MQYLGTTHTNNVFLVYPRFKSHQDPSILPGNPGYKEFMVSYIESVQTHETECNTMVMSTLSFLHLNNMSCQVYKFLSKQWESLEVRMWGEFFYSLKRKSFTQIQARCKNCHKITYICSLWPDLASGFPEVILASSPPRSTIYYTCLPLLQVQVGGIIGIILWTLLLTAQWIKSQVIHLSFKRYGEILQRNVFASGMTMAFSNIQSVTQYSVNPLY